MVKSHSNLGRSLNTGTANPGALNTDIFDIEKNYAVWILVDILFYTLSLLLSTHITRYETCILMCLDLFLLVVKDEHDKLKIFHSLPKVFVLHVKGNPFIVVMSVVLILSHLRQQHKSYKSILFFLAITCGVYFASFGISKMYAASFGVSVIAAFVYMWETATFTAIPRLDDDLRFEQLLKKEDIVMKDHAIAQDLVAKLKKLKVALSIEKERNKKIEKDPLLRLRSVADKDSRDDNGDKDVEKEEDIVLKNMLDLDELKQLIEILVSQSSQEMKYWLPKDIVSVLNNEEVSAYLWAYLNTQDMIPTKNNVKKLIKYSRTDSLSTKTGTALGEDYNFDLFTYDKNNIHRDSLVLGCMQIFKKFKCLEHLGGLQESVMISFLNNVQSYYFENYYHNKLHATDVTNSIAFFLNCGFKSIFSNFEITTLLISAAVHDVGHPGYNNAFMVAVGTSQALIYNDQSVLENYHCSLTFQIIQKEKNNILKNLPKELKSSFRKILINNVLSTDLSKHYVIIKKFESSIDADLKLINEENRFMAMSVALKCADVGHSAKSLELHKIWSRRVTEEFWNQGDNEQKLGLPIAQLCERKINIAKSQDGFLGFVALPLFECFGKFLNKYISQDCFDKYNQVCLAHLHKNREYWQLQIQKGEEGNKEFIEETDVGLKNFKMHHQPIEALLGIPLKLKE